ncbi:MAG: methyltransferase [Nonlabens sp.]|uniref:THUMP-like domain-containing protein n=1 Tax=Nonlabens sp. TaxID=1888209 RepID=UPI003219637C
MNLKVVNAEINEYLRGCLHENAADFMLKKHPYNEVSNLELTQQLVGLQKAKNKFPWLFKYQNIIYPPKVNLEQTSSEVTAIYKSQLLDIDTMIDITGGFGIDVSAFAKACTTTTHVEFSSSLQPYAQRSFLVQGISTKSFQADGIEFLKQSKEVYDLVYVDPSRKTDSHSKAVLLKDYEPNVIDNLDLLLNKGRNVMIKTSPMLDITAGINQLQYVESVHIVAVKNDVKELLWILSRKEVKQVDVISVNLETEQPVFKTMFSSSGVFDFSKPQKYLYEPNAAVMKSQQFDALLDQYPLRKLDQDAHLFTSDQLIDFPGRVFEIRNTIENKPKKLKRLYAKTARGIVTRNNKESVATLRKKYQFKEHETNYLFFTSSEELGAIVIEASKL